MFHFFAYEQVPGSPVSRGEDTEWIVGVTNVGPGNAIRVADVSLLFFSLHFEFECSCSSVLNHGRICDAFDTLVTKRLRCRSCTYDYDY